MRAFLRIFLILSCILLIFIPPNLSAIEKLAYKLEKDVFPGTTNIEFANQTFRFTTTEILHVKFVMKSLNLMEIRFKVYRPRQNMSGLSGSSSDDQITIYWENQGTDIYNGPPPADGSWSDLFNTESGFTEK